MYSLGSRLKETRIRRNLTQKVLAAKVNKSVPAISSYELNTRMPPLNALISIASVLDVSLNYFAGFDAVEKYSTKDLQPRQRKFLELLFSEFSSPNNGRQAIC